MKENIPVLLLKKLTILPSQEVRIELNNELSKKVIDLSTIEFSNKILIVLPSNTLEESPTITDLPKSGVLTLINSKIVLPNNNYRVVLKGLNRVKINNYQSYPNDKSILIGNAKMLYIDKGETLEETALRKRLVSLVNTYIKINPEIDNSIITKINNSASLGDITDIVVTFLRLPKDKKIYYMNEFDDILRAKALIKEINIELEIFKLDGKIEKEIKESFAKEQKEFVIKERIRKLNEELGVSSSKETELNDLKDKIDNFNCPEEVKRKLSNELQRYEYTPASSPEISMIRTYIDTLLSLPYNQSSTEETSKDKIRKELDKTHYGLEDVKNRIIEYAVLKKNNPDLENPIICLVGAPGIGKTSIAYAISNEVDINVRYLNATINNKKDFDIVVEEAKMYNGLVIIMDEIHRLNKDKQDLLLPYLESGLIILIGMTTSNPYHKINPAIRSRCQIFELKELEIDDIINALKNATNTKYLEGIKIDDKSIEYIANLSNGDLRFAYNFLELAFYSSTNHVIDIEFLKTITTKPVMFHDKDEDGHYDVISAFQKSIRGSDVNASLHYLARLIEAGDFDIIYRRMTVIAYEDIGLANPSMGPKVDACINACERIGFPEARIPLSVMIIDMALSPKSNNGYMSLDKAITAIETSDTGNVPNHIKTSSPDYKYPHDYPNHFVKQQYLPDKIKNAKFFEPKVSSKYEASLVEYYKKIEELKK